MSETKQLRLEGGKNYSLQELFSGDNDKIVIPDLQRDYCWGSKQNNLVGPFIDSLLQLDKSQDLTMGLIYGYYDPLLPNHLQLCDGQQRITTLFLLMGSLNLKLDNRYKQLLISNFELEKDDCEPYLQYSIRESSLYFISDLVVHYFLQNGTDKSPLTTTDDIRKAYWYLQSYDTDPTIQNILSAIDTIEEKIKDIPEKQLTQFGDFVSGFDPNNAHIKFLYYDMGNRTNGEETFVVINTTGEPLSATQNLKPLVIKEYKNQVPDIESKWEEMETWFWQHRDKTAKAHTSDEGMSEFFRCFRLYKSQSLEEYHKAVKSEAQFPYKRYNFADVYKTFQQYARIYLTNYTYRGDDAINYNNVNNEGRYSAEQLYALLPTLRYCDKFSNPLDYDIQRVYHLFNTIAKYQDVNNRTEKDGRIDVPVKRAIDVVDSMTSPDILCLKDSEKLNEQERAKLSIIANNLEDRAIVEHFLARAEKIPIFNGRLKIILDWCDNDFSTFKYYINRIKDLWTGNCDNCIDQLRRALLTQEWDEYPIHVQGKSHLTLGWRKVDWYRFFEKNDEKVRDFLTREIPLDEYIRQYDDISNPYYYIIKDEQYISKSSWKNVYVHGNKTVILMERERATVDLGYFIFYHSLPFPKNYLGKGWRMPWEWKDVLYCRHDFYCLSISIRPKTKEGYWVNIGPSPDKKLKPYKDLSLMSELGLNPNQDGFWGTDVPDIGSAKELTIRIARKIEETL